MKNYLLSLIISGVLSVICGFLFIPVLNRVRAGQPIYEYVKTHKNKSGTPTMGGLFFIIPSVTVFLLFGGYNGKIALFSVVLGLSFMVVGFLDDFIKIKGKNNQGLKPYQKIIFQVLISVFAGIFALRNNLTVFYMPFGGHVDLGVYSFFIIAFIFIAITNSVNLTDGLDGLASGVSVGYLIVIAIMIFLQTSFFSDVIKDKSQFDYLIILSFCLIGGILGFLCFNVNNAKVFMGDTGSLSLGGFIGAISVFSANSFFIPIIGIMFVISSISVIIQVISYKRTKKRVFLMAPVHHHLQMKGLSETKISYIYFLITLLFGLFCLIYYL